MHVLLINDQYITYNFLLLESFKIIDKLYLKQIKTLSSSCELYHNLNIKKKIIILKIL